MSLGVLKSVRRTSQRIAALLSLALFVSSSLIAVAQTPGSNTFTNPLKDNGPDPWVYMWNGNYYYMNTTGRNLTLWKTSDITDLRHAEKKAVWTPEANTAYSKDIWAPEIYRWDNKWYIYFAADDGSNANHRIYAVENSSADPMDGDWTFKGKVADATDRWAIDADVFEANGQHYMLWSGWKGPANGEQDIFIAHMSNPWTIDSPRTLISSPNHSWEQHGDSGKGNHINVNEGPEALIHGNDVFVIFSGSGCWTDDYSLGALRANTSADLLKTKSWKKLSDPLFTSDAAAGAFGTGHNGFFKSPDGNEDWIIYHANGAAHQGCGGHRTPRIQRFTWNADGTPNFGRPAPVDKPLAKPSGTK